MRACVRALLALGVAYLVTQRRNEALQVVLLVNHHLLLLVLLLQLHLQLPELHVRGRR